MIGKQFSDYKPYLVYIAAQEVYAEWMTISRHCGWQNKSKLD